MATADEYRAFARECLKWAEEADTDEVRDAFIQMALDWKAAALRTEGIGVDRTEAISNCKTGSGAER